MLPLTLAALYSLLSSVVAQDDIAYSACPLIGAYYSPPSLSPGSDGVATINEVFTDAFDSLIRDGGSEKYGPISANTTSFAVALFRGSGQDGDDDNPIIFEYLYTSPADQSALETSLTRDSRLPIGDVTMVFTVSAWLLEVGESWDAPITEYLPELRTLGCNRSVRWDELTIGALAGQMSGLVRSSGVCEVTSCDLEDFIDSLSSEAFIFHPDTTPVVSYAAFQLLVFAMQRHTGVSDYSTLLSQSIFGPLGMNNSGLLSDDVEDVFAIQGFNKTQRGEPGALSMVSTLADLAKAGQSLIDGSLLSSAVTRRWLRVSTDTSNLRNGVGRPWEIYRAGSTAITPIIDALTKSGTLGQYASYFGLVPEYNAGFVILAHDATVKDRKLDLNVHADIASEAIGYLTRIAAAESVARFAGTYTRADGDNTDDVAVFNGTSGKGHGLRVEELRIGGVDIKAQYASQLGIEEENLDFRVYPTNVKNATKHQFLGLFQDETAPIDMGTPTCITWQEVGAVVDHRVIFQLGDDGVAESVNFLGEDISLERA